jgi:hypothetical protein
LSVKNLELGLRLDPATRIKAMAYDGKLVQMSIVIPPGKVNSRSHQLPFMNHRDLHDNGMADRNRGDKMTGIP